MKMQSTQTVFNAHSRAMQCIPKKIVRQSVPKPVQMMSTRMSVNKNK